MDEKKGYKNRIDKETDEKEIQKIVDEAKKNNLPNTGENNEKSLLISSLLLGLGSLIILRRRKDKNI